MKKDQFKNNGAIQLYIAREGSGSGGKLSDPDLDPAKRSGSATLFKVEVGQKCKFFISHKIFPKTLLEKG